MGYVWPLTLSIMLAPSARRPLMSSRSHSLALTCCAHTGSCRRRERLLRLRGGVSSRQAGGGASGPALAAPPAALATAAAALASTCSTPHDVRAWHLLQLHHPPMRDRELRTHRGLRVDHGQRHLCVRFGLCACDSTLRFDLCARGWRRARRACVRTVHHARTRGATADEALALSLALMCCAHRL
jgi:hypothetical protein